MIIDHHELDKAATWADFLVWYGQEVGRLPDAELEADAEEYSCSECGTMADAELRRRAALEAA